MPIKRRLTDEQRLRKHLGDDWDVVLRHPLLSQLIRFGGYPTDSQKVREAIRTVTAWKKADYRDKVFVLLLAALLYRMNGQSFLTDANYNRLKDHLRNKSDEVLTSAGLHYHGALLWDLPKISKVPVGELVVERLGDHRPKRRKLKKHRK